MTRTALAVVLSLVGVVLVAVLTLGPHVAGGDRVRLVLDDARPSHLDTVAVRGRKVHASLDGHAAQIDGDGQVWLSAYGDAFPLRFKTDPGLHVEDRVLVTGRLRARGGQRWLAVSSWSRVRARVAAPPAPEL